jgi:hypothetical protein
MSAMLSALVMIVSEARPARLWATSVVVERASRMMVSPSLTRLAAFAPILCFLSMFSMCWSDICLNLPRHRAQESAAMLEADVAVHLHFLEILANRRLRYGERGAQVADARAPLLLAPVQNLAPPRLGEQSVEVRFSQSADVVAYARRRPDGS